MVPERIQPFDGRPFKLRIGGAYHPPEEGFVCLDSFKADSVDYVVDLVHPPWPVDDSAVNAIFSPFYFHRLGSQERWVFMNECCRILKPKAQLSLVVPHWSSMRAITDPLAQWPPLCESSFLLYSKKWREDEKMSHLPLSCDFGGSYGYGYTMDADVAARNEEMQQLAKKHALNAVLDLHVTLTKE